jgi:DNA-binding transcriptional MerR regulator
MNATTEKLPVEEHDDDLAAGNDDDVSRPGYFPIRVVSLRTGVNSVTLRAWERRYGLLKPVRTPKGHRLYSEDDVARVAKILDWVDRGISIGRVRGLLAEGAASETLAPAGDGSDVSDWQRYNARLLAATAAFDDNRLDDTLNEALSLYPFATVCDRLLNPLEQQLHARWRGDGNVPGHAAERVFYEGWLRRKLASRIVFDGRLAKEAPVLISALPGGVNLLALRTLAIGCIGMDMPVVLLEEALAAEELIVAADRRRPRAVLLHGDDAQDAVSFSRHLQKLTGAGLAPLAIAGAVARVHATLIAAQGALALDDTSLAAAVRRVPLDSAGATRGEQP